MSNFLNVANISVVIPTYNRCVLLKRAINSVLKQTIRSKKIIVVDEQTQYGNLSSAVQSELSKYDLFPKLKNISLPDEYVFENGGRDFLHKKYNLDEISILNFSKKFQ